MLFNKILPVNGRKQLHPKEASLNNAFWLVINGLCNRQPSHSKIQEDQGGFLPPVKAAAAAACNEIGRKAGEGKALASCSAVQPCARAPARPQPPPARRAGGSRARRSSGTSATPKGWARNQPRSRSRWIRSRTALTAPRSGRGPAAPGPSRASPAPPAAPAPHRWASR